MKTKMLITATVVTLLVVGGFWFITQSDRTEQQILESTYDSSKQYLSLRLRTDDVLINAESYTDHAVWNDDMTRLIQDWQSLEKYVSELETTANKQAELAAINLKLVTTANAYTAKEINTIYDKAPKFKGIATLAKHLGVDAKRAQLILNQAQNETTAEVFGEEGNAFENLENTAIVVKDGCKVVGFVGGVVLTGGTAGLAAAGTMTQVGTVIVGVDLALEVTEDGAQIAMGDRNKVSSFVKGIRTVTEPIASVISITSMPSNLGDAYGKFDSVMVGLEQFREAAQEGKVVGVDLKNFEYQKPFQRIRQAKYPGTVTVAEMEKAEVEEWLKSLNTPYKPMTQAEVKDFLSTSNKQVAEKKADDKAEEKSEESTENNGIIGSAWKGSLESVSGGNQEKQSTEFEFVLNKDGSVSGRNFKKWKQEGDRIKLFGEDEADGHYEFKVSGDHIILTKMVIGKEVIEPGQEFMGGFAPSGILYKQSGEGNGDAMPISEFNELSDGGKLKDIASVTKSLGEPDVKTTDDDGRIVYVYYDLVKYDSGNLGSVKMAFYNEEDYRSYIEGAGASWDSNQETWDESGGGIRASEEIRSGDTYKNMYKQ
jgi:hypothetical protein